MSEIKKRASMSDVARLAGVTDVTVSNVLKNKGRFSESVRERVLAAARELDYRSNLVARGLRTGRSHGIGVLLHQFTSYLVAQQLEGAEEAAARAGYHLVISAHKGESSRALEQLEEMQNRQLDGAISLTTWKLSDAVASRIRELQMPFAFGSTGVITPAELERNDADRVVIDQSGAGRLLAEHLLDLGRRNIVVLSVAGDPIAAQRLDGARAVFRERGLPWHDERVIPAKHWGGSDARAVLPDWLDEHPMPDAILAVSERLAAGAMRVLGERGLRVPDDVAVVGIGDTLLSAELPVSLTTVDLPLVQIGARCVERVIERLENPANASAIAPQTQVLPCRLIVRESCGSPNFSADAPLTSTFAEALF